MDAASGKTTGPDRWNLLLVESCRACGRPAAELCDCPWCGEAAPVSPRSHGAILLLAFGLVLLALGGRFGAGFGAPAPVSSVLAALAGWLVAAPLRESENGRSVALPAAALAAGLVALAAARQPALRAAAAGGLWLFPLAVAACLAAVPAPLPPVPGATVRARLAQRFAPPLLVAAPVLAVSAWTLRVAGSGILPFLGLACILRALGSRLRGPAVLLVPAAACLAPAAPDPAAFALAVAAAGLGALARR